MINWTHTSLRSFKHTGIVVLAQTSFGHATNIHQVVGVTAAPLPICLSAAHQSKIILKYGIPTGYGLEGRGSIPGRGKRFFSTLQRSDLLWGPAYPVAIGGYFPEVKRPERKADHSPSSSDEVNNSEAITPYRYHNDRNLKVFSVLSKRNNAENITAYFLRSFKQILEVLLHFRSRI